MKKAVVLMPTYNKPHVLDIALKALLKSSHREDFDICVIDNGSIENNEKIAGKYKSVIFYKLDKNYFISGAINKVFFKYKMNLKYKNIIILAHDALVDKNTISELIKCIDGDSKIGMTGPTAYQYGSKTLSSIGLTIDPLSSLLIPYTSAKNSGRLNHFASCLAVKADVFYKAGGLNAVLFPMVFEEPDLGERIMKLGYNIVPCTKAKIYHPIYIENKSIEEIIKKERILATRERSYLFFRNRIIYMSLHTSMEKFLVFYFFINPALCLYYLPTIKIKFMIIAVKGFVDGSIYALLKNKSYIAARNRFFLGV